MYSKKMLIYAISVLGFMFALSIVIGLSANIAIAENPPGFPYLPDECGNNNEFTTEFRFQDCQGFKNEGANPYFILKPGYQLVLEGVEVDEEEETLVREEATVLCDTKVIYLNGRRITTRVVEERALEWDDEAEEWVTIEISRNWVAICNRTNDIVYFGEFSRDCPDGFDENDECEGGAITTGSWEAGVNGALPGILMPGTFLLGSKYFQEIAPMDSAVDRAEHVAMGVSVDIPELEINRDNCVTVVDTNPVAGECGDEDAKTYCPRIGKVTDAGLELVSYGFVGCGDKGHDRKWRRKWGH